MTKRLKLTAATCEEELKAGRTGWLKDQADLEESDLDALIITRMVSLQIYSPQLLGAYTLHKFDNMWSGGTGLRRS